MSIEVKRIGVKFQTYAGNGLPSLFKIKIIKKYSSKYLKKHKINLNLVIA